MTRKKNDFRGGNFRIALAVFCAFGLTAATPNASAQNPFTAGDIVVSRVSSTTTLNGNATAEFLDEYTTSGTFVQSIALPTTASNGNHALTDSGSAGSDGYIKLSTDGQYITIQGYDAAVGTASVASAAGIPRDIGLIKFDGTVDTKTEFTDGYLGNNLRSSIYDPLNSVIYLGGASSAATTGGVRTVAPDGTSSSNVEDTLDSVRNVAIFNNTLYFSSGSGTFKGVNYINSGTVTNLIADAAGSPEDFYFANASTVYIADTSTTASGGGLQKYISSDGGATFTLKMDYTGAGSLEGLTGTTDTNGNVTLFATTTTASANKVFMINDTLTNTATASVTSTTVATTVAFNDFKGVAFAPVAAAEPSGFVAMFIGVGGLGLLVARRRTKTMSAA